MPISNSKYAVRYAKWENKIRYRLQRLSRKCEKLGLPFNLTVEHMETLKVDKCPILGVELDYQFSGRATGSGKLAANCWSIDRIIPELGYVVGNVQIISMRANELKRDATLEEMKALGEWAKSIGHSIE